MRMENKKTLREYIASLRISVTTFRDGLVSKVEAPIERVDRFVETGSAHFNGEGEGGVELCLWRRGGAEVSALTFIFFVGLERLVERVEADFFARWLCVYGEWMSDGLKRLVALRHKSNPLLAMSGLALIVAVPIARSKSTPVRKYGSMPLSPSHPTSPPQVMYSPRRTTTAP